MSTTELFVELIIIGTGATIWVYLLAISIFGFTQVDLAQFASLTTLVPFLSLTYVMGIVVDRVADTLFERIWSGKIFSRYYQSQDEFYKDRRILYIHEGRLADLLEYGRSRLRICRGWALNSTLILITSNLFIWIRVPDFFLRIKVSFFSSIFCSLLTYGTWFSWYKLTLNDYRRVKEQSTFLRQFKSQSMEVAELEQ
jgi:hypothetical protein